MSKGRNRESDEPMEFLILGVLFLCCCILMIFIDFQFYLQFYYTLLSLITLLRSLTLTTLTHTHILIALYHHLFYIVNNVFSHIRTATVQNYIQYNTIQYNAMQCNAMQCNAMQCNTIVYWGDTLSYNNGVPSQTEPKSGSVKAGHLIYRYST